MELMLLLLVPLVAGLLCLATSSRAVWERLEGEIDELVYALYGLTPEEIKLVEGAAK